KDRKPGADRCLRQGGAAAHRSGREHGWQVDRGAGTAEAGDSAHDRCLPRDGEPGGEGPAAQGAHPRRKAADTRARQAIDAAESLDAQLGPAPSLSFRIAAGRTVAVSTAVMKEWIAG